MAKVRYPSPPDRTNGVPLFCDEMKYSKQGHVICQGPTRYKYYDYYAFLLLPAPTNSFKLGQMQPALTPAQGHTQDRQTYTNQGYVRRSSPARAPHPTPFGFTPRMEPHHDSQPHYHNHQGIFRDTISTQPGGGNDPYWGNSVNSFSRTSTDSLGTGAPPPWRSGEFAPPYPPYGHFGPGGINNAGFPVIAEQMSNYAMNFSHPLPGTGAPQSNQGAIPVWQLCNCWINYETQGELHLTIVFRKVPFA